MTSLTMLLAEELEAGLDQIQIEPAPVDPVYTNRLLGEQATGGWNLHTRWLGDPARGWCSGADAHDRRRRPDLGRTRVRVSCAASTGSSLRWNARLTYGELAATAASLPMPSSVALKSKPDWTLIGTSQRRLDTPLKVRGAARFGLDVRLPGMLYATIARCPVIDAEISGWNGQAAREVPGVIDVFAVRHGIAVVAETVGPP
jgi:isoquinoline 1-oxidoreductase subunit beta